MILSQWRVAVCLLLSFGMSGLTLGSTATVWTGSESSLWTATANWDNGVPLLAGYTAFIQNAANNPVSLTGPVAIDGLTTGAANSLIVGSGAALETGALTNAGTITLAGGTLTLQGAGPFTNSGTIQNAAGGLSRLGGNLTNTGTIAVSNNSGLQFTGGSTYTNDGQITLNAESTGIS